MNYRQITTIDAETKLNTFTIKVLIALEILVGSGLRIKFGILRLLRRNAKKFLRHEREAYKLKHRKYQQFQHEINMNRIKHESKLFSELSNSQSFIQLMLHGHVATPTRTRHVDT